ncbi:MAG: SGNH/GDSL hydrolase family protein [Deltaproteobacteria bacterium]|nr:SGNH/GDSL hydrolase family protein [Deltaproteobacteria bacterium]
MSGTGPDHGEADDAAAPVTAAPASPGSRVKRALANFGLVLASLLVALLLLEGVVRVFFGAPRVQGKQVVTMKPRQHHEPDNTGADCYPSNPRGYFVRSVPDDWPGYMLLETEHYHAIPMARLTHTPYCVDFSNNVDGYRGARRDVARQPNTFRVLAIGDSFTYGEGVKDPDTMPAQLEKALQARHPELAVEVINLAQPGINTEVEINILRKHLDFQPDVVVLGYVLNDAFRVRAVDEKRHAADDLVMFRPGKIEKPSGVKRWLRRWSRLYALIAARLDQRRIHKQTAAWYTEAFDRSKNADGMDKTQRMLDTFVREARGAGPGAGVLVAVYPMLFKLGESYPFKRAHAELEAMLDKTGAPWLDLRAAYAGKSAGALVVHAVDHHPNELAQRLAAEAIAAELERLDLVHARPAPPPAPAPVPGTAPSPDAGPAR